MSVVVVLGVHVHGGGVRGVCVECVIECSGSPLPQVRGTAHSGCCPSVSMPTWTAVRPTALWGYSR